MSPLRRKIKQILLYLFIGIILFWLLIIVGGYHFYTVDIPVKIPWILILLLGAVLRLAILNRNGIIAVSIIFPLLLVIYIPIMWWVGYGLIIGIEGDLQIIECKKCNKKVISYFHQGYWGGAPLETTGVGQTYLGGLLYKTEVDTTYGAKYQFAEEVDTEVDLPTSSQSKDLVFVWKGQKLLLVFKNQREPTCYPLTYK